LNRIIVFLSILIVSGACAAGYDAHPGYPAFESRMVKEHGFDAVELRRLFAAAERKDSILEAMSRPAEKALTWGEYRQLFISRDRIDRGVEFWRRNEPVLARAAVQYGVPAEIVVAIIGVETRYGGNMGKYRVIDALSTLAFDYPPRAPFFTEQLEEYLLMTREQKFDPLTLVGSYAGAMGLGQFIPSSFRRFALDYDADGRADIWNNPTDAVGSVANYFNRHGWRSGGAVVNKAKAIAPVDALRMNDGLTPNVRAGDLASIGLAPRVSLPAEELVLPLQLVIDGRNEYWLGRHNFHVITRYNHSVLYAMAVYELSQSIRKGFVK
jgi:membrane-bound lytic murein transglycosylase B